MFWRTKSNAPPASPASPAEKGHLSGGWTLAFVVLTVGLAVVALYGVWAFWPSENPNGRGLLQRKTVHFFWWDRLLSRESLFFVMVAFAGALGGMVHAVRSLAVYVGNRQLKWNWAPFYVLKPVLGAILATLLYFVLRAGLFSPSASTEQASPYGFAAIGALSGLFSDQAVEKLRKVAEELFEKLEPQKEHFTDEPPVVATGTPVPGSTDAVVKGTVNPRGNETTYRFDYGPTASLGTPTAERTARGGTDAVAVEETLTGLLPKTKYYYRLVATSKGGTTSSDDGNFTTS
jgi:hypothetical protein